MEHTELQKFDQRWDVKLVTSPTIKATHTSDAQKLEMHQSRKDSNIMEHTELHSWFYGNPPILTQ
jgi:hypothetical protein